MNSVPLDVTRRNLFGNIAKLFSNSAISQGFTALALLLTARELGATLYGQLAACLALASVLSVGFNLGLDIWLLREGARSQYRISELIGSSLSIKLGLGLIWVLALSLIGLILQNPSFPPALLTLTAIMVWLDSILMTALSAFKASLRNEYTLIIESSSDFIWFIGTLILIYLGTRLPEAYVILRLVILLATCIIAYYLIHRLLGLHISREIIQISLKACPPYALSEFLALALMRLDVIIVAFALGNYSVGLYSPAVSIVNALFFIPLSVYMVMVPSLSHLFESDLLQAWKSSKRFTLLLSVVGGFSSILLFVSADWVVALLGESFAGSGMILRILSVILLLKSLSFAMAGILVAGGRQSQRVIIQAIAVVLGTLLNLAVVFRFGINGVAVVFVITELILFLGYMGLVRRFRIETMEVQAA
jgi:O-antigen/teichoic acid export membrane protein